MLTLLVIFLVGFASDFLIVKYYQCLSAERILGAVACNTLIFIVNVVFVGLAGSGSIFHLGVFLGGQNAGIWAAIWFGGKNVVEN